MSKKRKTRKEKEAALLRRATLHIQSQAPVYSIERKIETVKKADVVKAEVSGDKSATSLQKDKDYLKRDIALISGASGIIVAFDILLFALLSKGVIRLPFFGY